MTGVHKIINMRSVDYVYISYKWFVFYDILIVIGFGVNNNV